MTGILSQIDPVFAWALRASLALLFASAAFHKASHPGAFTRTLRSYRLVPGWSAAALTPLFVLAEAAIAAGLVVPATASLAAPAGAGLLGVYSLAIAANLVRGRRHVDCGCFGPRARQPISGWLLARNAVLISGSAIAALEVAPRTLVWVDGISVVGAIAVLALLFGATNALLAASARPLRRSA